MRYFKLIDKTPVQTVDVVEWTKWMGRADKTVKLTELTDSVAVLTVFSGLDHHFIGDPLPFETKVFGGKCDGETDRHGTWQQAELGHEARVSSVSDAEEL